MAPSPYERFRRAIRDLTVLSENDVQALLSSTRLRGNARLAALQDILPDLVDTYGEAAATVAADYYDDLRESLGVGGSFTAEVPEPRNPGTRELIGWAASTATDDAAFKSLILGGMQRRIANRARVVVQRSSHLDPKASGWMRIGSGGCDFCAMLITRGAVYSEASVDFASHDRCNCQAAPAFDPEQVRDVKKQFVPTARRRSEATTEKDAARVNEWISNNL